MSQPLTGPELAGSCPIPKSRYPEITMGHGAGGQLMEDLIHRIIVPTFDNDILAALEDQATLSLPQSDSRLAFTTDSYVVQPLFFPGGDIGKLAVHGTVNDLAVGGARPLALSAGLILEEGLPIETLERVLRSMGEACRDADVRLVTGDTKVVERGKGDQIFINTSGVGLVAKDRTLSIASVRSGDKLIVSGTLGDHGIAILSVREGLEFETTIESDSAPLSGLTEKVLATGAPVRVMRDLTRGGLSSVLHELARSSQVGLVLEESAIPLKREVRAACEILGLDPLYVANEGKLVAAVPAESAEDVLDAMRQHPLGADAAIVGEAVADHPTMVLMRSAVGGERVVTMISGEQLPRIC